MKTQQNVSKASLSGGCRSFVFSGLFSWLLILSISSFVIAQSAAEPAPEPDAAEEDTSLREQTIYVPYSKLQKVFEQQDRGVFLPYEEFQKLWKQARAAMQEEPDQPAPVAALITEINSQASVGDEVVRVTAQLKLEILRKGWHEIPLRLADASIQSAKLGDQPARLLLKPGQGYALLVQKQDDEPEQLDLTIEYSKAFTKSPGRNSVSFQAPQAPVNQWQVRIPQQGIKVSIEPLVAATEPPPADDAAEAKETVLMAFVGAADSLRIDWTPKAEGAMGLEALAMVEAAQKVEVDEGVVRTRTQLTYKISRAELAQLTIETPADHRVLNVFDPNVREWTVEQQDDRNRIQVQLYEPARETQQVTIELEKFSDDLTKDGIQTPIVQALNVARQQGILVVAVSSALRGEISTRSGLLQLDASELPSQLGSPAWGGKWDYSYRYATLPFELSLTVEKVEPEIRVHELVEAYLEPNQLTMDLFVVYDIARAGVFQLELDKPVGFDVKLVRGHAASEASAVAVDTYHEQGEDKSRLVVNLSQKAIGRVGLFVQLQRRLDDTNLLTPTDESFDIGLPLPRVAPDGIEQSTGRLIIYAPESLRVNPGDVTGAQSIAPAEALEELASTRNGRFPTTREILAYAYSGDAVDLTLVAQRRKPYITCDQLLSVSIDSGVIKYQWKLFYQIQYSGVESLRLDVPQFLVQQDEPSEQTDLLRNTKPNIASELKMDPQPDDVPDGYVAMSLTGKSEFLGKVTPEFSWEHKVGDLEVSGTVQETIPRLIAHDANLASGQIVLAKAETLDVRPAGELKGLRPIDPQRDLRQASDIADAARAFEFQHDSSSSWELTVDITRYDLVEVKRTSIERAVLRMEVTRGNEIAVQALYRVRSARQRLPIQLPAEAKFDARPLRINGKSNALEQGGQGEYFVPLTDQTPEDPFLLELRYTVPGNYQRLELPTFPTEPAIQKVYLCAYLPDELAVLGSRGPWTDELDWRWYETRPVPKRSDSSLVNWVIEDLDVPNPFPDFSTDGLLYTYSTVQPAAPPEDSSLRVIAIKEYILRSIVFVIVLFGGSILIRHSLVQKFAAVVTLCSVLLIVGVFVPVFARQIMDWALLIAVLIVLGLWAIWQLVQVIRAAKQIWSQRRAAAAEAARQASEQAAEEAAHSETTPPPPPEEAAPIEAEAVSDSADGNSQGESGFSSTESSETDQEGDRNNE